MAETSRLVYNSHLTRQCHVHVPVGGGAYVLMLSEYAGEVIAITKARLLGNCFDRLARETQQLAGMVKAFTQEIRLWRLSHVAFEETDEGVGVHTRFFGKLRIGERSSDVLLHAFDGFLDSRVEAHGAQLVIRHLHERQAGQPVKQHGEPRAVFSTPVPQERGRLVQDLPNLSRDRERVDCRRHPFERRIGHKMEIELLA